MNSKVLRKNEKWRNKIRMIQENDWRRFNSSLQKIKEIELKNFHFQITNRILVTFIPSEN